MTCGELEVVKHWNHSICIQRQTLSGDVHGAGEGATVLIWLDCTLYMYFNSCFVHPLNATKDFKNFKSSCTVQYCEKFLENREYLKEFEVGLKIFLFGLIKDVVYSGTLVDLFYEKKNRKQKYRDSVLLVLENSNVFRCILCI